MFLKKKPQVKTAVFTALLWYLLHFENLATQMQEALLSAALASMSGRIDWIKRCHGLKRKLWNMKALLMYRPSHAGMKRRSLLVNGGWGTRLICSTVVSLQRIQAGSKAVCASRVSPSPKKPHCWKLAGETVRLVYDFMVIWLIRDCNALVALYTASKGLYLYPFKTGNRFVIVM